MFAMAMQQYRTDLARKWEAQYVSVHYRRACCLTSLKPVPMNRASPSPLLEPLVVDVQCHSEDWSQQRLLLSTEELHTFFLLPKSQETIWFELEPLYAEMFERDLDCIRDEHMPLARKPVAPVPELVVTLYRLGPVKAYLSDGEMAALWSDYSFPHTELH
ncbi:hypothetical protein WH50_19590 [Pokkaliibacter plantistimulans]|uniref:Uncharacterized protein n=2 Tax=Pokkaliibacter plantistimulans TaxID=1635171 RepID=A0ABX5LSH6_9GAMM|nr:hypothetical protein WH50_19590 [Pokkaliibacter plantistimulans]